MSKCGNVKKVFVPTDEAVEVEKVVDVATFDCTSGAIEKIRHFIQKDNKTLKEFLYGKWKIKRKIFKVKIIQIKFVKD